LIPVMNYCVFAVGFDAVHGSMQSHEFSTGDRVVGMISPVGYRQSHDAKDQQAASASLPENFTCSPTISSRLRPFM
jgi:hypothetical protein